MTNIDPNNLSYRDSIIRIQELETEKNSLKLEFIRIQNVVRKRHITEQYWVEKGKKEIVGFLCTYCGNSWNINKQEKHNLIEDNKLCPADISIIKFF